MSSFPEIVNQERGRYLLVVVSTALLQAIAAAFAAVATRDVFSVFLEPTGLLPLRELLVLAGSGIVIALGRVGQATVAERLGQSFAGDLRERLFCHLSRMPRTAVQNQRRGGLSLRFVGDLSAIRGWAGDALPKAIAAGCVLPAACAAGFLLHPMIGSLMAGSLAVGLAALALTARQMRPLHRALRRQRARLSADMSERAPQAPDLRLIGRFDRERARLRVRTRSLTEAATARRRAGAIMRAVPDIVSAAVAAGILAVSLTLDFPASLAAGGLAAAAILVAPLRDLAGIWDRYSAFHVARAKCIRLFQRPTLPFPCSGEAVPRVTFCGVSHGPLRSIDRTIDPGSTLIVQGPYGAGKSTFLRLAAGHESPESGMVKIGDGAATQMATSVGVCLIDQYTPILSGSLRRCLTLGAAKRPSDKRIQKVAEQVGLGALLTRSGGLDAHIAEFGRNLSDGERWRVLIGRALLSQAQIILLDCPDRGLDREALGALYDILFQSNRTVLMALGNLEGAVFCKDIPVLDLWSPATPEV